jgi:hypothetical protein
MVLGGEGRKRPVTDLHKLQCEEVKGMGREEKVKRAVTGLYTT